MFNTEDAKSSLYYGRFKDPSLEKEFFRSEINSLKKIAKPVVLIFAFIFAAFFIPDLLSDNSPEILWRLAGVRIIVFTMLILFYRQIERISDYETFFKQITLMEFITGLAFVYIVISYENPNILLQVLSINLFIFAFNIVPNKLIYSISASATIWIMFMFHNVFIIDKMQDNEFLSAIIFPLLFMITLIVYKYRLNSEKRIAFLLYTQAQEMSVKDSLTHIYNRYKFDIDLQTYVDQFNKKNIGFSLIMFDIDDFKSVNDTHGHIFADSILVEMVRLVENCLTNDDVFARWGGEEFIVILPNSNLQSALLKAAEIRNSILHHTFGNGVKITCSFGVTSTQENDTIDEIVRRVDNLLYQAKTNGKNQIAA